MQRVLTALFKDRSKVNSLLKEGAHCFQKEQKILFGETFQKKVYETIKSKKKTKELLKEYTKPTLAKRPYHYRSRQPPFQQDPNPCSSRRGHESYQNKGFLPRDGQRKFYSRGGRGKLESHPPCDTYIQHMSQKTKTPDLLNLNNCQKVHPFVKTLFKEIRETFPLAGRLK